MDYLQPSLYTCIKCKGGMRLNKLLRDSKGFEYSYNHKKILSTTLQERKYEMFFLCK